MNQAERTAQLGLDLGITIKNRLPHAKEVFKVFDVDLLPHSSPDLVLGELFSWTARNYRSDGGNVIGYLYKQNPARMDSMLELLKRVPRVDALMPDFEFTKENVLELGGSIPSLFDLNFTGKFSSARDLKIKVTNVKKARLTNYEEPGRSLRNQLSGFAQLHAKVYRNKIKRNYLAEALFFADSVEVQIQKTANQAIDVSFDPGVEVEVKVDNATEKHIKLTYTNGTCPFGAIMRQGKDFMD